MCKNCYDKWLKKNNPKFLQSQKDNHKKWIDAHREENKRYKQDWTAKQDPLYNRIRNLKKYGLTIASYDELLQRQNGVCFICQQPPKKDKNLHVDHNHKTGNVRGLLCFRCNFGLSFFGEDEGNITRLYDYICKNQEPKI